MQRTSHLFAKNPRESSPVIIEDKCIEVVESGKLLGLTLDNKLTWNSHIEEIITKV